MARRELRKSTETLSDMIKFYASSKTQQDFFKKAADKYNLKIKEAMQSTGVFEVIVDDIRASISTTPRTDFNELQAIEILRSALTPEQFSKVVKSREYIDDDAFENLVYNHEVDAAILSPAETQKPPTVTLRLGKVAKKEEGE